MYLPVVAARFAVALAALSGTTAAMGMNVLGRDSTLAAELGIGPAELLGNYRSVLEIALQATSQNLTVQYATVGQLGGLARPDVLTLDSFQLITKTTQLARTRTDTG